LPVVPVTVLVTVPVLPLTVFETPLVSSGTDGSVTSGDGRLVPGSELPVGFGSCCVTEPVGDVPVVD
jgi:hypothetical protein